MAKIHPAVLCVELDMFFVSCAVLLPSHPPPPSPLQPWMRWLA